jgi:hypothetical protein
MDRIADWQAQVDTLLQQAGVKIRLAAAAREAGHHRLADQYQLQADDRRQLAATLRARIDLLRANR